MTRNTPRARYRIDRTTLTDADDLFSELDEAYDEVTRIRGEIERVFNQSPAREMLHGFVVPGRTDLTITWQGDRAEASIPIIGDHSYKEDIA